ncbi:Uncharacterized protein dnl_09750 [Desulfonema limicola]|uniref:Uncharacterized protein n=1 Tax=Desulfonema limicola TaxID=45656 RepID=A0A975B4P3_9BACT|nr:hypothetical protein [Desulfonema limicola]QTA78743.1 Uncharacterized protein dnl_09750 [Desulfonema limicola]
MKNNHPKEIKLAQGIKSVLLSNLNMAESIEARKHQYNLILKISEALHEIFVQYVWMAHCFLLLPASEQKKLADSVHISLSTCKKVGQYLNTWENIPEESRELVLENIEKQILEPVIEQLLSAQEKEVI